MPAVLYLLPKRTDMDLELYWDLMFRKDNFHYLHSMNVTFFKSFLFVPTNSVSYAQTNTHERVWEKELMGEFSLFGQLHLPPACPTIRPLSGEENQTEKSD